MSTNESLFLPAFGAIDRERVLASDDLFVVIRDKYPLSPGHALIIPRRAVERFGDLTELEKGRLMQWIAWTQGFLSADAKQSPDGFNFGANDGRAAGQTMPQFHFHVIPRYVNDVHDPRGGIRWVISEKARYW